MLDSSPPLDPEKGMALVRLARSTLIQKFQRELPPSETESLRQALAEKSFQAHGGTFVTLKLDGELRGCIGNLSATETLVEGVRRNALNAAFHDPRFSPLSDAELDQVRIEVSVLTKPRRLEFTDSEDLLAKLRPHVDGLVIRKAYASATFLPQVWEQLPKKEDFLSHLCLKAGLPRDAWKRPQLEVSTYQVQHFEEQEGH
jgi:AmmeMemoRadiSam system protein A